MSNQFTNAKTRNKIIVDLTVAASILILLSPKMTGENLHEWIGVAGLAAIVAHLLLSFDWFAAVTRRLFQKQSLQIRLNYWLSFGLFIAMTAVFYSGLMISKVAMPALGIAIEGGMSWKAIHSLSSNFIIFLTGLHLALNWKWVATHILGVFRKQPGRVVRSFQPVPQKVSE